jgi:hypothetical protein
VRTLRPISSFLSLSAALPFPIPALAAVILLLPVGTAWAAKTAEDFVGPATVQPLPDAGQKPPAKAAGAAKPAAAAPAAKASAPAPAAKMPSGKPPARMNLDTARIHATYLDGDFEQAIRLLEAALKSKKTMNHADSVFIYKHLGVMYAATPATREKGRYYMLQLISIEPTAKILDMYASDMIYLIFRNVQEEFETRHGKPAIASPADTVPPPVASVPKETAPAQPVARQAGQRKGTLYWVTGGAVVAAGTAGLLFILLDNPKPKKHNIVLDE